MHASINNKKDRPITAGSANANDSELGTSGRGSEGRRLLGRWFAFNRIKS